MFQVSSSKFHENGFTLLELMLALAILIIIGVVGTVYLLNLRDRKILDATTEEIVFALREAQQKSISQEVSPGGATGDWGICFDNQTAENVFYALYAVLPCTSPLGNPEEVSRYYLNKSLVFLNPSSGNKSQITFLTMTGMRGIYYSTSSVTIALRRDNTISRTIIVNDVGVISY